MMSRVVSDLFDISEFAHHGPENLFISLVKIFGSFIILYIIYWPLALFIVNRNIHYVSLQLPTK